MRMTGSLKATGVAQVLGGLLFWASAVHAQVGDCGKVSSTAASGLGGAQVMSDLSIAYLADQPASPVVCAMGYPATKCGDFEIANKIFDKCIAKGYVGAMIWKGLMYEDGTGVERSDEKAAEMFKMAATSEHDDYSMLGKLHYADALWEGRGVPQDRAEALKWFQKAASAGSEDAREFLRTGQHTGSRDFTGKGFGDGTPPGVAGQVLQRENEPASDPHEVRPDLLLWSLGALGAAAMVGGAVWQSRAGRRREAGRDEVTA